MYKLISLCAAVAIAATGVFLMAAPAGAQSRPVVVTAPAGEIVARHIPYGDLNLASASGERALTGRVRGAVRSLCGEVTDAYSGSAAHILLMRGCRTDAWGQARPQMALAVQRSRDLAMTGKSGIAAAAITITIR